MSRPVLCSPLQGVPQDVNENVTAEQTHDAGESWAEGWRHRRTESWEPNMGMWVDAISTWFRCRLFHWSPLSWPSWVLLFFWDSSACEVEKIRMKGGIFNTNVSTVMENWCWDIALPCYAGILNSGRRKGWSLPDALFLRHTIHALKLLVS